ncbi:MAG: class I SAM-dependent methyltransferase [bacterium]
MDGFLNPVQVIEQLGLSGALKAADLGCGSGGWAIPLAKKLKDGFVYAIDVQEAPLSALNSRAQVEKVGNIRTIIADVEGGSAIRGIGSDSLDLVLMTNLLFQVDDKKVVMSEAKRMVRPGGKILIVDWKKNAPTGPKGSEVAVEDLKTLAGELNLFLSEEFDAGGYHYGIILVK